MTPLQKIAMGLLIIVLVADFNGWDGLPNPLGWLLVIAGVRAASSHLGNSLALTVLAWTALATSVLTYPPAVDEELDQAATWLLGLPQLGFEVVLCSSLAAVLGHRGRRFRTLSVVLVLVGLGPAIAIGSESSTAADVTLAGWILSQLALIWMLFSASGHPETGAKLRPVRPTAESAE
ncbi:MAG TPA: hypothetical protein VFK52_03000 [Nocardioidaceae bacterium]|nr:hypothetical protein [Nocardioidaceae bacterium]